MKKLITLGTVAALMCCICVVANGKTDPEPFKVRTPSAPVSASAEAKRNEKLRADMLKLVSDAKAGKLKLPAQQFPQSTNRNNLSKGAKIAIGVGIAAAIIFAILWHTTGPGSD